MFSNLIESGSHAADLKRKGRFFLGTIAFYGLLLAAIGVGSIYAYNARLEEPPNEYEVLALLRNPPAESTEPARRDEPRPAASQNHVTQVATRTVLSVQTPYHGDDIAPETARDIDPHTPVRITTFNSDPAIVGGPVAPLTSGGLTGRETGPIVESLEPPAPPVRPTPTPAQRPTGPVQLPSQIISSKAISKPAPPYPIIAKQVHIQGPVAVQIVIDEQGRVISAKALSGPPLLLQAAVQAAYRARFTPTILGGQPVKVTGSITYNFVLN
jgi:protein TonB